MMHRFRARGAGCPALVWSLPFALAIAAYAFPAYAQVAAVTERPAAAMAAGPRPPASRTVARAELPKAQEGVYGPEADRPADSPKKKSWDEHHGLLGPVRLGPVIGTGIPNIQSFGVTSKLWGLFGLGFNVGRIPDMQVSFYGKANVRYSEFDAYARVYPFRGGLYLGMGVGRHSVRGTIHNSIAVGAQEYSTLSEGSVKSLIVTPQIGYFRNFAFGLALGFGIGAQVPVSPGEVTFESKASASIPPQLVQAADKQVVDTLRTVGRTPLPQLEVRLGWLF